MINHARQIAQNSPESASSSPPIQSPRLDFGASPDEHEWAAAVGDAKRIERMLVESQHHQLLSRGKSTQSVGGEGTMQVALELIREARRNEGEGSTRESPTTPSNEPALNAQDDGQDGSKSAFASLSRWDPPTSQQVLSREKPENDSSSPAPTGSGGYSNTATPSQSSMAKQRRPPVPEDFYDAELDAQFHWAAAVWRAAVKGSFEVLALLDRGPAEKLRDRNGHSLLWVCCSHGHTKLALAVLKRLPFWVGSEPIELHPKRGDSLLHLIVGNDVRWLQDREASEELFHVTVVACKEVHAAGGEGFHTNNKGETFAHHSARALNFWVLQYIFVELADVAPALLAVPAENGCYAFEEICQRVQFPTPATDQMKLREARTKPSGSPDLVLQCVSSGPVPGPVPRQFSVHRSIFQGTVLEQASQGIPDGGILEMDPRVGGDVCDAIVDFLYTGFTEKCVSFGSMELLQLLLACGLYQLPGSLTALASQLTHSMLTRLPAANFSTPHSGSLELFHGTLDALEALSSGGQEVTPLLAPLSLWLLRHGHLGLQSATPGAPRARILGALLGALHSVEAAVLPTGNGVPCRSKIGSQPK